MKTSSISSQERDSSKSRQVCQSAVNDPKINQGLGLSNQEAQTLVCFPTVCVVDGRAVSRTYMGSWGLICDGAAGWSS